MLSFITKIFNRLLLWIRPAGTELSSKEALRRRKVRAVETDIGTAYVRVLSGRERREWMEIVREEAEKPERTDEMTIYAPLLMRSVCNSRGERVYSDGDVAEVEELDGNVLLQLFNAAIELSRLDNRSVESEKKG